MKHQNIEKLFKDSFSNFEADVNPSAWANIQQSLPAAPQNVPGKPSGFFGKMYLSTIALVVVISAAIIGTVAYLSSEKSVSKDVAQNVQTTSQPAENHSTIISETAPLALGNNPAAEIKNTPAEKQTANKAEEKAILNKPAVETPSETKAENTPNTNSIKVLMDEGTSQQVVPSQENTTGGNGKVSTPAAQNSQQETNKSFTPPVETSSAASSGHSSNLTSAEEISNAEYKEEFHFFIPSAFTPNGDMINDYFTPIAGGSNAVKEYQLIIYDRYGFEIFRTNDITVWWDGKLKNGDMAAIAVYVYTIKLIDFKDEAHDYIGYVALLK
jgi:gliding motility-associated-like protein